MPRITLNTLIYSDDPFHARSDYHTTSTKELERNRRVPIVYTQKGPGRAKSILINTLSVLFIPVFLHNLGHTLMGYALLPASMGKKSHVMKTRRVDILKDEEFIYKRITIKTKGGHKIDAIMVGTKDTIQNRKWILESNGNQGDYESKFAKKLKESGEIVLDTQTKRLARETNSNVLVFNYPSVSNSSGTPSKNAMRDAYDAALSCLEDEENGIGAKQIIGFGHSIGGGVQGEALKKHKLKEGVEYVFVKSRTFTNMHTTVSTLKKSKLLGLAVRVFKWDLNSEKSSTALQAPEIILQTANVREYTLIDEAMQKEIIERSQQSKSEKGTAGIEFTGDHMISEKASLAYGLITNGKVKAAKKYYVAIPDNHDADLTNLKFLADQIEKARKEHYK